MPTEPNKQLISEIEGKLQTWFSMSVFWERIYWITGILGIASSAISAVKEVVGESGPIFAVIATICYGFIGFANPQRRSARYIRSYRLLDPTLRRYKYSGLPEEKLYITQEFADNLLNDIDQAEPHVRGSAADTQPPKTDTTHTN